MTREEAIDRFKEARAGHKEFLSVEALDMAIKALEQEPCCNCIEFKRYAKEMGFEIEQEPVLDKIRSEIERNMESIIGKYDSSIPKSNMPSYKIERNKVRKECISIIDKYKAESEDNDDKDN